MQAILRTAAAPADGSESGEKVCRELEKLRSNSSARSINGLLEFMQSGGHAAMCCLADAIACSTLRVQALIT